MYLRMNADGNGATYRESNKLTLVTSVNAQLTILPTNCDLIAGIIAYWASLPFIASVTNLLASLLFSHTDRA